MNTVNNPLLAIRREAIKNQIAGLNELIAEFTGLMNEITDTEDPDDLVAQKRMDGTLTLIAAYEDMKEVLEQLLHASTQVSIQQTILRNLTK